MPTLSVVLTNYNYAHCVNRAIEAVVNQSRPPDEFIIQDDGSTDHSIDVIMPYVKKYPYIKFVKNEKNLGHIPAMQKVVSYATGDYIYGAASDDYILPGFFEKAMNAFAKYPQAGLFCGDLLNNIAGTNEMIPYEMYWSDKEIYVSPDLLADIHAGRNFPGSVMRRDEFIRAGGFIAELKWHSDWFFYHVIAFRKGLIYRPEKFLVETSRQQGAYCFEGMKDVQKQAEVLRHTIQILKSPEFIDVLPYFARGAVLFPFSRSCVDLVMKSIDMWDIPTQLLMAHPFYLWNMEQAALRSERARIGAEQKITSILEKINTLILNGSITDASGLLDTLETAFGKIPQILELRQKITSVKKVVDMLRSE
ncbi:MAG: glycosyltransferase family 2 protein [Fibrobacterota bacterium]